MSIDPKQLRGLIARVLDGRRLHSHAAMELLMGTAAQESCLGTYLHQIRGPALGIFQMEPATEADIWQNYLRYKPALADAVRQVSSVAVPSAWALETNLAYQIIMARLHYYRVREPLPDPGDIEALGRYWKKYYNTAAGRGTVEEFVANYRRNCL